MKTAFKLTILASIALGISGAAGYVPINPLAVGDSVRVIATWSASNTSGARQAPIAFYNVRLIKNTDTLVAHVAAGLVDTMVIAMPPLNIMEGPLKVGVQAVDTLGLASSFTVSDTFSVGLVALPPNPVDSVVVDTIHTP